MRKIILIVVFLIGSWIPSEIGAIPNFHNRGEMEAAARHDIQIWLSNNGFQYTMEKLRLKYDLNTVKGMFGAMEALRWYTMNITYYLEDIRRYSGIKFTYSVNFDFKAAGVRVYVIRFYYFK